MTISVLEGDGETAFALAGRAELRDAGALRDALAGCLEKECAAAVLTSGLESVDAAILQIFLSAQRSFAAAGVKLRFEEGPAAQRAREAAAVPSFEGAPA